MKATKPANHPHVSIGVIFRNEEDALGDALKSLFEQLIFAELRSRNLQCEVICVASGCTDNSPLIAKWFCDEQNANHPCKDLLTCRTVAIPEPEKTHAWNLFTHCLSTKSSQFCFLMDGNIVIDQRTTLWNMYAALTSHSEAVVAVDQTRKAISRGLLRSLRSAFNPLAKPAGVRFNGQLYCIRADAARNIYLPEALPGWEDEFIETIVCTEFLTRAASHDSILLARNASHLSEPSHSMGELLGNQWRQAIGQAVVHIIVDDHLRRLPFVDRVRLAETLQREERRDPSWLSRLLTAHLSKTKHFWELFPGLLGECRLRLAKLNWCQKVVQLPSALARLLVRLASCWMAYHSLKHDCAHWLAANRPALPRNVADRHTA